MNTSSLFRTLSGAKPLFLRAITRRLFENADSQSRIIFRYRSMYDYHDDEAALTDFFGSYGGKQHGSMSTIDRNEPSEFFRIEYTDSVWCMTQYPESYCLQLVDSSNNRITAVLLINLKQVYFGPYLATIAYQRMLRVHFDNRRQGLATSLQQRTIELFQYLAPDYTQNYTAVGNIASTNMQRSWAHEFVTLCRIDTFLLSTDRDHSVEQLHELSREETEHLWIDDMTSWVNRPVLSDMRRIMQMKEYRGTFSLGTFDSGQYVVESVWCPSTSILCVEQSDRFNRHRGSYYTVFNIFQSPLATSSSNDGISTFLSAIGSMAKADGLPFVLCQVEQTSPFHSLVQKQALATKSATMSSRRVSSREQILGEDFRHLTVCHDPRDLH